MVTAPDGFESAESLFDVPEVLGSLVVPLEVDDDDDDGVVAFIATVE
jgi:hypothetical protein